jgi:hypothetical protein
MSRAAPWFILLLAALTLASPATAAQEADAGTNPSLRMTVRTVGGSDGGEPLAIELPPEIPIDRPFELRTWLPAEVEAASATYWRAGGECAQAADAGESRLPLKTVVHTIQAPVDTTDAGFVQHGKELVISVPVLSEPWWSHCFAVELWLRDDSGPLTGTRLTALLREVTRVLDETREVTPADMRNAATAAGIFQDCRRVEEWSQRHACELALNSVANDLSENRAFALVQQQAYELRGLLDELRKNAATLNEQGLVLPSYEQLLALYGHEPTVPSEAARKNLEEARAETEFRRAQILRDAELHEEIASALGVALDATRTASALQQELNRRFAGFQLKDSAAARTAARELHDVEKLVAETSSTLRREWFKHLRDKLNTRGHHLKKQLKEQELASTQLEAQRVEAKREWDSLEGDLKLARQERANQLAPIMARLGKIQQLEANLEKTKAELAKAKEQKNPPADEAQLKTLEKAVKEAESALANAQPNSVRNDYERTAAKYDAMEKWIVSRIVTASNVHLVLEASKLAADAKSQATQQEIAACAFVLSKASGVEAKALDYENAFRVAVSTLRATTISVVRPQGHARSRPAATHVERAYGFFSTDVGFAAVAPRFGDPHPMAFVQLSLSLGRVSWDHGLGAVNAPKGIDPGTWLRWQLGQRLAFNFGLSMNLRAIRTPDGQLQGLFGPSTPMGLLGLGFRFTEFLKLNAGTTFGTTQPELPGVGNRLHVLPYVGLSIDIPVYKAVGKALKPALGTQFSTLEPELK